MATKRHHRHGRARSIRSLMIDFVVIQMDIFHMMSRELAGNTTRLTDRTSGQSESRNLQEARQSISNQFDAPQEPQRPLAKVLRLRKFAHIYHKAFMYFYLLELIRYVLIDLLTFESFHDYQLLDCFILGRFRFIGRTNKISGRIVFVFMFLFGFYRILVFNVLIAPFKFYALEFLMYEHKQVVLEGINFESRAHQIRVANYCKSLAGRTQLTPRPRRRLNLSLNSQLNPIFYIKSLFRLVDRGAPPERRATDQHEWILRPNRSARCWLLLDLYTRTLAYGSIAALLAWTSVIHTVISGSILSDLGFELSYPSCAGWLQRQQLAANSSAAPYGWIYAAPPVLAGQLAIDNIPAIIPVRLYDLRFRNAYQTARILLDFVYNQIWYTDFMFTVSCVSYLVFMSSLDVILNAAEIHRRLGRVLAKMELLQNVRHQASAVMRTLDELRRDDSHPGDELRNSLPPAACYAKRSLERRREEELGEEVATIQATLADHFNLVRGYNHFISFALTLILGSWCVYSLVLCLWMGSVQSAAVEFEFLVTEIGGTFFAVLYFSGAAIARSLNYRLYSLIARATALDGSQSARKLRWANIMKFYSPEPKYCFTLLGFAEISSLFCLQFVFWIVSAYIVLTKFFYVNRQPAEMS